MFSLKKVTKCQNCESLLIFQKYLNSYIETISVYWIPYYVFYFFCSKHDLWFICCEFFKPCFDYYLVNFLLAFSVVLITAGPMLGSCLSFVVVWKLEKYFCSKSVFSIEQNSEFVFWKNQWRSVSMYVYAHICVCKYQTLL